MVNVLLTYNAKTYVMLLNRPNIICRLADSHQKYLWLECLVFLLAQYKWEIYTTHRRKERSTDTPKTIGSLEIYVT